MTSSFSSSASLWRVCKLALGAVLLGFVVGAYSSMLHAVSIDMPKGKDENLGPVGTSGETTELKPDETIAPDTNDENKKASGWNKYQNEPARSNHQKKLQKAAEEKRNSINKLRVDVKGVKKEDEDKAPKPNRKVKITKITYTDKNGNQQTATGGSGPANGSDIDIPADADLTKPVEVDWELYEQVGTHPNTGEPIYQKQAPDNDVPIALNFTYHSGGLAVASAETGPTNVYFSIDASDEPITIPETAALYLGLSAQDYDLPDLMFHTGVAPKPGHIQFTPVGQFRFTGLPAEIYVFDQGGNDLIGEYITLGEPHLTERGDLVIPVYEVTEGSGYMAMLVRGVSLEFDDGADANSVHGYTVTGSALGYRTSNVAAIAEGTRILDNWETLSFSNSYSFGSIRAPEGDAPAEEFGSPLFTVVQSQPNEGFLRGIVLEGASAGSITTGTVVIRGIAGLRFLNNEDTKLYVVDADTGANVSGEVTAALTVNARGDLVATLEDLGTVASNRLKIAVVAPMVGVMVNLPHGRAMAVAAFGSALKSPSQVTETILEGGRADLINLGPLASTPPAISGQGWEPAASCE